MRSYRIRLSYRNIDTEDLDLMEAIAEHAPEVSFGQVDGNARADAVVEATCATAAVETTIEAIRRAAPKAEPIEAEMSLVSISEIAVDVRLNREAVRLWTIGRRGPGNFPHPVDTVGDRIKVWAARAVWDWLNENSLPCDHARPLSMEEIVDCTRTIDRVKRRWNNQAHLTDAAHWKYANHSETTVPVRDRIRAASSF